MGMNHDGFFRDEFQRYVRSRWSDDVLVNSED
uniref:Uncharacterized protein n=1 Tax=Arundo donax TaxID=35708 RepID=A0A0A9FB71_ARUDO